MHRKSFLKLLKQYRDSAPYGEYSVIDELKEFVTKRPDCFERKPEEDARHIAASVLLLTPDFNKALFLWHTKIQRWTQPGGHADGDSDIHAVALRELEEETGISGAKLVSSIPLDIYRFSYPSNIFGYRKNIYNLFFVVTLPKGKEPKIMEPNKCEDMRWATIAEALKMIEEIPHEGTERLIMKWKNFANTNRAKGK